MKRRLSTAELRSFGLTFAGAIAVFFGLLLPWWFELDRSRWPWIAALALTVAALAMPRALAPIYAAWRPLALAIGWVNTRLILGLVFFVIIMPFGLAARLAGKLQYLTGIDRKATTYRVAAEERGPEDYERPF